VAQVSHPGGSSPAAKPTLTARCLDGIERVGNKMPSPAILFLLLCVFTIALSQVLFWLNVHATYETVTPPPVPAMETYYGGSAEPTYVGPTQPVPPDAYRLHTVSVKVQGLLTADGVRYLFTSFVSNFRNFAALAIILVVMVGVGLAETAGLIGTLIRKLVAISSESMLTPIIVALGVVSSIASDAGYLVLIPLGAAAFKSVGRNPLAGIAAAFAGVAAGFGVNFLITPLDAVLVEITNDAIGSGATRHIDLVSNLWFGIGSTIFVVLVLTFVSARFVEGRLGNYDPALADESPEDPVDDAPEVAPADEARGLRYALWGTLAVVGAITLLTAIPGAPLRNPETGEVIGDSPFMDSLIVMITIVFFVAGWCYGKGAGTIKTSNDVISAVTKSWASLTGLLLLFLLIAQFVAYFNFSHIPDVAAVKLGDVLEHIHIGAVWLLIGVILIAAAANFIIPQAIPKWALLAPIFIPLFIRLGIAPQTVLAAFRVGDSPTNVVSPLNPYFALVVIFAQRYDKNSGIGTFIAIMLPYTIVLIIAWTLFFVAWYILGLPLGPGWPLHL
jgi:aminobenzoyl-glutamate transport protein